MSLLTKDFTLYYQIKSTNFTLMPKDNGRWQKLDTITTQQTQ